MLALAAGVAAAAVTGQLHTARLHVALAEPVLVRPAFTWQAVAGIAVPLFIVTMASQNIPGVAAGTLYLIVGIFGATVGALLVAFPAPLVLAIAGLGLLGTIGGAVQTMVADPDRREAAVVTFLFAASGVTLLGIGAPFWALVAGTITLLALQRRRPASPVPEPQEAAPARP
jgi:predicted benzoate:H+ symporter BenE